MSEDIEQFLDEVEWVSKEVEGILSGKIDAEASEKEEKRKLMFKELEKKKQEEEIKKGREGKGIKFERYKSYCKYCMREFELDTPKCTICGRDTITSDQRKQELTEKVAEYKQQKSKKDENRMRWENWKKTEAMLYKKNSTNYKKWEFFEESDEGEPETEFIPPENDPNFAALEKDIKERGERRKRDLATATELKEKGNEFYTQGKYRNAIVKYEEAMEIKKDLMVLYTNCAAAKLRIDDFEGAIKDCSRVVEYFDVFDKELEANKETVFKALYRRGDAYRGQKKFCEAILDYEKALELKQEKEIENILERCREEAADSSATTITEEINDSATIMSNLDTPEKIQAFRVSGGYQILFKRIHESMDIQALNVLEFLMSDETKFMNLQPLILPLYDKRQTAAVIMIETLVKYIHHEEFCTKLTKILALSIENLHIREEISKHSATTKGKKFYKLALELFLLSPPYIKHFIPIISNLCLTIHKTAFDRKPSPGNMKSLIRYNWRNFIEASLPLLLTARTEILGLLCNVSSDVKVKKMILDEKEIIRKNIGICGNSSSSLDIERSLGFLINILSQPTELMKIEEFFDEIWKTNTRFFYLESRIDVIDDRALRLLFRLLLAKPILTENFVMEPMIIKYLLQYIDKGHADTIAKILAAATASKSFVNALDLEIIARILNEIVNRFLNGEKIDERIGNYCLAIGRIVGNKPESSVKFTSAIPELVRIIKEKIGPVRKNVAVCLGKLCNNETNKEVMREVHGLEVLSSVMEFINK